VSYEQRVALDARYVREQGFLRDLAILLRTPRVVLARTGAR
jgi:lipopolysaccharide/colanic/teichoic acid biosynthesis glycosyltransferase